MKKILSLLCATMALFVLLWGCGPQETEISIGKPVVAVSIVPEKTFVEEICGDLVEVVVMIPPGASPENYEPTPKQMEEFSQAQVYFSIGVPAEEQGILPMVSENTKVVDLAAKVAEVYPDLMQGSQRDPHIWLSPKRVAVMIQVMTGELCALDPDNAANYNQSSQAFLSVLSSTDEEIRQTLSGLEDPSFIVYHPAFGYFADEYGLTMYALEDEGKEATAKHLAEMADLAKEKGIKAVFYQAEVDKSQAMAFAEEIGGTAVMLEPLSADYIGNLKAMAQAIAEAAQ